MKRKTPKEPHKAGEENISNPPALWYYPQEDRKKRWRKPYFETVEEMELIIDKYFRDCYTSKPKIPINVTWLTLALWFDSRQTLLNYKWKEEFMDTIKRALLQIENYNECALMDSSKPTKWVIFCMTNNFQWRRNETFNTNKDVPLNDDEQKLLSEFNKVIGWWKKKK